MYCRKLIFTLPYFTMSNARIPLNYETPGTTRRRPLWQQVADVLLFVMMLVILIVIFLGPFFIIVYAFMHL